MGADAAKRAFRETLCLKHKRCSPLRKRGERADSLGCATCQSVLAEYLVLDPKRLQARVLGFGTTANIPASGSAGSRTSVGRKP